MRIFVTLICSLALACIAGAQAPPEKKEQGKKKGAPPGQVSHGKAVGKPAGAGKPTTTGKPLGVGKPTATGKGKAKGKQAEVGKPTEVGKAAGAGKAKATGKPGEAATTTAGKTAAVGAKTTGKAIKAQHFDLPKQPNTAKAPAVTFQQGRHIEGSEHWQGQQYAAFRNYHAEWHDEGWWHNHYHDNIVFVFGAPYFFNAGYWFPAWGYYPNAYYAWDGPIYAYNHLPPDQVIANVQTTLQQQGYYHGDVDGLIGPLTRSALADYQRDHGLYETAAIDQPTLESLGMT